MKNEPIIIIGMHRSGTSMLTRFIRESGVFIGNPKKMGKNEEAFFFQKINEWILFQKGASWDNPWNLKFKNKFTDDNIKRVISERLNSKHTINYLGFQKYFKSKNLFEVNFRWGWKDPKNTLTLEYWQKIYPNAKIVHIYRNPIDVAQSLSVREEELEKNFKINFTIKKREKSLLKRPCYNQSVRISHIEEGVKLWEEYMEYAINAKKLFKNYHEISYENFLENPKSTLINLATFLEFEIDDNKINLISTKVNPNRKFAFINDKKLIDHYQIIKNNEFVKLFNYSNIL
jgi:hypothetical protein